MAPCHSDYPYTRSRAAFYGTPMALALQVKCTIPSLCSQGAKVVVTDHGEGDRTDFILSPHAFAKLALPNKVSELKKYGDLMRVPRHNIKIKIHESSRYPDYLAILIIYKGGKSEITAVELLQGKQWKAMRNAYGAVWDLPNPPKGPLTMRFQVSEYGVQKWILVWNTIPSYWKPGAAYDTKIQLPRTLINNTERRGAMTDRDLMNYQNNGLITIKFDNMNTYPGDASRGSKNPSKTILVRTPQRSRGQYAPRHHDQKCKKIGPRRRLEPGTGCASLGAQTREGSGTHHNNARHDYSALFRGDPRFVTEGRDSRSTTRGVIAVVEDTRYGYNDTIHSDYSCVAHYHYSGGRYSLAEASITPTPIAVMPRATVTQIAQAEVLAPSIQINIILVVTTEGIPSTTTTLEKSPRVTTEVGQWQEFKRHDPTIFYEGTDVTTTELFLKSHEKIHTIIATEEHMRASISSSILQGEADDWWTTIITTRGIPRD
ncbi:hypothetical protein Sjap_004591 [Stephania japonica]|uniref:Expansin-like CBD domain-containing protein n=1 Tax=Stephania japonica TaxID=461633 RepID=A0AAP0K2I2_9MAGN